MRTLFLAMALLAFLAACTFGIAADTQPAKGFFATLKPSQQVVMKEVGDKYEISILETEALLSHVIVEVGPTYVVVRDSEAFIERRIPVYSVKAIITINTQVK